ncbi:MAG: N-acetylmuramoyl-L-alanine amidase [Tannerella sp.]|nr:N-acetylmuramoyl-L-alanine amidase [Tannerella sp.]
MFYSVCYSQNKKSPVKYEPLFGSKYANYTVTSSRLKGATFFLVSGHGGPDCGAIGRTTDGYEIHEDEYAYDIMLRLARVLMSNGATVHIIIQDKRDGIRDERILKNSTRETCRGKTIPLNQAKRLQQRCDAINALSRRTPGYKRAVFIHLDSRSSSQRMDVFFYYQEANALSKRLSETVRETFRTKYREHQPGRGFTGTVSTRSLFVLNSTEPVSIFAELGNIRNIADQKRFLSSDQRQALANWFYFGLQKDFDGNR